MGPLSAKMLAMTSGAELGKRVYQARSRRRMSANQLGKLVGVGHGHIRLLEKGGIDSPGVDLIRRIAEALDVSAAFLLEGERAETGIAEERGRYNTTNPALEGVQVNLMAIGEMDSEEFEDLVQQIARRREKLERDRKEERDATARRRKALGQGGPADSEVPPA